PQTAFDASAIISVTTRPSHALASTLFPYTTLFRSLGQVVDLISHSPYWKDSAIFAVEDDSQDGMDHQDAHRIPALVISPYAKQRSEEHTSELQSPYDLVCRLLLEKKKNKIQQLSNH